jgi:hypothetical protein
VLVIEHRLCMLVNSARVVDLVREGALSLPRTAVARLYDRIAQTPQSFAARCVDPEARTGRGHLRDHLAPGSVRQAAFGARRAFSARPVQGLRQASPC